MCIYVSVIPIPWEVVPFLLGVTYRKDNMSSPFYLPQIWEVHSNAKVVGVSQNYRPSGSEKEAKEKLRQNHQR